jgi:hypothetical protein
MRETDTERTMSADQEDWRRRMKDGNKGAHLHDAHVLELLF